MIRRTIQFITAIGMNSYVSGFLNGTVYRGDLKKVCVPGLNCSSCPGAWGSCPLLMLQNSVAGFSMGKVSLFGIGFIFAVGLVMGRLACGWLCPFGLIQELLYKSPLPKVRRQKKLRSLEYLKYGILIIFVILLPGLTAYGVSRTAFCTYVCPVEVLEVYIPLSIIKPSILSAFGLLVKWKLALLVFIFVVSVTVFKPFCRFICPLGAVYALFNPLSLYRFRVEKAKCTGCGQCERTCKLGIPVCDKPNHRECMRCRECLNCPTGALKERKLWQPKQILSADREIGE